MDKRLKYMNSSKSIAPLDVLRNCRGKVVSVELANGETINGTVVRVDRAMNMVVKQSIRTGAEGDAFWKSRETLIRGASVRNVRMDERALKVVELPHRTEKKKPLAKKSTTASAAKRPRES